MILRFGVIAMCFSVMLALVVVAVVTLGDNPEEVVAAKPVASEPETKSGPESDPRDKMLDLPDPEPDPEPEPAQPKQGSEPEPVPEAEGASGQETAPSSVPNPELVPEAKPASGQEAALSSTSESGSASNSASEPAPKAQDEIEQAEDSLPLTGSDWPVPKSNELAQVKEPRHYDWIPGAVLALTAKDMGLHNAPVMGSDSQRALDNGIVHIPETSMPWTRSPQRNVYLAGHRLGWPGTGSRLIFYSLNKLENGDEIVLRDRQDRKYRYRVSEKFVVGFDERWVMGQIRGRDMVTLQTCTGPNFSKRLIVRADRV